MQLSPTLRDRLRMAACLLIASGAPAAARGADTGATNQLDVTMLLYQETDRVGVIEPNGRFTRSYADGRSYYLQFGVDSITGASPSGALPSGRAQTVTSASGHVTTTAADEIPLADFNDRRLAFDGGWVHPFGRYTPTLTGHYSSEKDYLSVGASGKVSIDLSQKMTTLTFGAGLNHDKIFPVGDITPGLSDPNNISGPDSDQKTVTNYILGVTQVLSRKWLMSATASRTSESGYLTEPYKILSLVDGTTGFTTGALTEERPSSRARTSILLASVYHLRRDVLSTSYRYYWDTWSLNAHTFDIRYRHDMTENVWIEPHLRWYTQTAADFFTPGLVAGAPIPNYATADIRLGNLKTATAGATLGFRLDWMAGEWRVRAEYVGFIGDHHPDGAVGVQKTFDLYPTVHTGSIVVDYSLKF